MKEIRWSKVRHLHTGKRSWRWSPVPTEGLGVSMEGKGHSQIPSSRSRPQNEESQLSSEEKVELTLPPPVLSVEASWIGGGQHSWWGREWIFFICCIDSHANLPGNTLTITQKHGSFSPNGHLKWRMVTLCGRKPCQAVISPLSNAVPLVNTRAGTRGRPGCAGLQHTLPSCELG